MHLASNNPLDPVEEAYIKHVRALAARNFKARKLYRNPYFLSIDPLGNKAYAREWERRVAFAAVRGKK